MAEEVEKPDESQTGEDGEISLDNIDEILAEEDPGFVNSLDEIKEAGQDATGDIDAFDVVVEEGTEEDEAKEGRIEKILNAVLKKYPQLKIASTIYERIKKFLQQRYIIWRGKLKLIFFNFVEHLKTWPDRLKKLISDTKIVVGGILTKLKDGFSNRTRFEKVLIFVLLLGMGALASLILMNLKNNRWVPMVKTPILTSLETVADEIYEYNLETGTLPFLTAFPQAKHNYLFPKVVVNLRAKPGGNTFQMGAFQFFVEVDSKDTAIEVKSREVELHDLIQRVVERFSYDGLQSEKGKDRLKEEIKKALNQKIVQGWVKGVYIKFMITKP